MNVQPAHARADVLAGRYVLERVLGTGGMATVWSATDQRLGRTVALKILRTDLSEDHAHRIAREARAAARIDDHRVVTVLDLEHTEDGTPFLVFEALSGYTLADELRSSGALSTERAEQLASDLLGGLAAAHDCGVLHRDIKPSNILIDTDGFRITDFGIASMDDEASTEGNLMGTLVYLAPERFDGAPATPQSDVFSAAAVLYESLSGRQPFRAGSSTESLARLRTGDFEPLPDHVPDHVVRAIADGLAPDPARRPADAGEFARRVDPSAIDATEHLQVEDPTERLDLTARLDQPTQPHVHVEPDVVATPDVAPAADAEPRAETVPEREGVVAALRKGRRPQAVFASLCVLVLILLLVATLGSGGGLDSPTSGTPDTPEEQLDQNLDRIEELGR